MPSCRVRSAKRISVESKNGGPIGGGTLEVTANKRILITWSGAGLRVSAAKRG